MFVFGDFNVHHKDWLTYSSGTDRPGEFCHIFCISNDLTQIVNFPTRIPDCVSHSPALLDLFISSGTSICSTMVFSPLGNSYHVVVSVSIDFPINSKQDTPFHRMAYVKPHSSPWFSAACEAVIVHRNHFFRLYQQNKSSESKVKFRQASNRCKRVLEAAKLAYVTKTKESITSQKLRSRDFWRIANSVLNKGKSAIPPLFNGPEVLSSASDKAELFAKNFSKNQILMTLVSLYLFSLLELI